VPFELPELPAPPADLTVVSASAFYKNDAPGGVGVQLGPAAFEDLHFNGLHFCHRMLQLLPEWSDRYGGSSLECVRAVLHRPRETAEEAMSTVMDVWWMQLLGDFEPDEFNGVCFACLTGGTLVIVEENPLLIDWSRIKEGADLTEIVRASRDPYGQGTIAALRACVDHERQRVRERARAERRTT